MFTWIADRLIRHRWAVLLILAAMTAAAVSLAPRLRFDFTPQAIFQGNDDLVDYDEAFKAAFGHDDAILLVLLEATGRRDVLDRRALTWQAEVARDLAAVPGVLRVASVTGLPLDRQPMWRPPWIRLVPIITDVPVTESAEVRLREALAGEGLAATFLLSADRRIAALVVSTDPAKRDVAGTRVVVEGVRAVLAARPPPADYVTHVSGLPALRADIVDHLRADQGFLLPVAGALFLVMLGLMFRRISGTLVPVLAVGMGLAWTVGVLVLSGQSLNIVSNVLPVLLFVIGMANCVHVVSRYAEEWEWAPGDRDAAARRTITHMALACLLTSLTTAIGFTSLFAARSAVLRALGWHAVIGIALLYVTTIAVLGSLLPLLRPPRHGGLNTTVHPIARVAAAAGHAVARRPRLTLLASAALVVASLWSARHVVVNSHIIETYDAEHPTTRTMRLVEERLAGVLSLEVSLQASAPDAFLDPAVYRAVAAVQRWADRRDGVLLTASYVDVHQEVYAALSGGAGQREVLPAPGEAGRRRIRATAEVVRLFADDLDYRTFMTPDGRRARIMVRVRDVGTRRLRALICDLEATLADRFPPDCGVVTRLTGEAAVYTACMTRFVYDLLFSLGGASVIIFAVIALLFRSGRLGLVSVVPNVTPLVVTLGYMGLRGYDMNATNVIVFAVSLGIAVDNTIHFLARYREEVTLDGHVPEAIRRSFHGTGRAIVLTSVMIAGGVAVLLLSEFVPTRRFAELMSVTAGAALVGNLLLLPACLMLIRRRGG